MKKSIKCVSLIILLARIVLKNKRSKHNQTGLYYKFRRLINQV
ncbi:hypothetical protein GLYMA_02G145050v4 [Glycine max]|nr:hypothetical protein GLYMA_02G145050v4 [Glycine max]KAH1060338.1 hypothetical protein GYH30_004021 [Glycine max]